MSTTVYTWNPLTDSVIEESDGSGNVLCTYTNEPSRFGPLISENRGGTSSYYHADAIGSTRLTTNNAQAVVDSFLFDAWGNTVASAQPIITPYHWCGRWGYQANTALEVIYVRERTFGSGHARWISIDPLHNVETPLGNDAAYQYIYANNTPASDIDPAGLDATSTINNTYTIQYLHWAATETRANPLSILYGRNNFIFMTAVGFAGGLGEVVPVGIAAAGNDAREVLRNRILTTRNTTIRGAAYAGYGFVGAGEWGSQVINAFTGSYLLGGPVASTRIGQLYLTSPGAQSVTAAVFTGTAGISAYDAIIHDSVSPSTVYSLMLPATYLYRANFPPGPTTQVSTWTFPPNQAYVGGGAGWVQLGPPTRLNLALTGLLGPQFRPTAPYLFQPGFNLPSPGTPSTAFVPPSDLSFPPGLSVWRGLLGQRLITPPTNSPFGGN